MALNQLRRSPAFGQVGDRLKTGNLVQVEKNSLDHRRVFNTGNDVQGCTNAAKRRDARERPLDRMSRCREAQGCARAAKSLLPAAQLAFCFVPGLDLFCLYPARPASPAHGSGHWVQTPRYSPPVPNFSETGHWAGTCARGLRINTPKHSMLAFTVPNPRVRLSSSTNTQGVPRDRLPITASQNSSSHVLCNQGITFAGGARWSQY